MKKAFNLTGTCFPDEHYMADISKKFDIAMNLIQRGSYFAINRPRQFGKTTLLETLNRVLVQSDEWLVFKISFESMDNDVFAHPKDFCKVFVKLLAVRMLNHGDNALQQYLNEEATEIESLRDLSFLITKLVHKTHKKLVLLIDEVDKSSNNQLFLDFLALLRHKYLNRHELPEQTFHSVILTGLHDVKSLKAKLRPEDKAQYNSPWNIAADFKAVMELQPNEIVPMLQDYAQEQDVTMDFQAVADALFYYTSGYPFLVSALCKITDEDILPNKTERTWTAHDIETAADLMIKSPTRITNFDTLVKNLEEHQDLFDLIYRIVINGETIPYDPYAPLVSFGLMHGILRHEAHLMIHNRIYREVIANYMTVKMITERKTLPLELATPYMLANNGLDMRRVLLKFQELMQIEYSKKDTDFLERNGRLVFLAFLKPIINGKGYAFKEPEISEERRMDIAITFLQHQYVVELKVWRGKAAHTRGLAQLKNYLDRQQLPEGFLVIFEPLEAKSWKKGWIKVGDKRVFAIWV
jgi:hypothetical protein